MHRLLACALSVTAAAPGPGTPIVVELTLEKDYRVPASNGSLRFADVTASERREGRAPGDTRVWVEPRTGRAGAYEITVDTDGDGSRSGEGSVTVAPETRARVLVRRHWGAGRENTLPYDITVSPSGDARSHDEFGWRSAYRARGRLKVGTCETEVALTDYNGDGTFDHRDTGGASLYVDRDGNGRMSGARECLRREEIVDYCGKRLLLDRVEPDGSAAIFVETPLEVAKIGETVPDFSLATLDGRTFDPTSIRGKVTLLDFWASWCVPCVEKFPTLQKLSQEFPGLTIVAINVDTTDGIPAARQVVDRYRLTWPQVMTGQAEDDPAWKIFGGMEGNHFAVPQYVLIGPDGTLVYAGHGGEALEELRASISRLPSSR